MALHRGVLDASVLYVESVRSLLLWIATQGGFAPFWTARILEETQNNLIEGGVVAAEQWDRLHAAMLRSFPDAMLDQAAVDAIEDQMPNDEKDRHVLAAAVVGDVELVVTSNTRHFAAGDLQKVAKRSITPDELLCELLRTAPGIVRHALQLQVAAMRVPRLWSEAELLGLLGGLGHGDAQAPRFVRAATAKLGVVPVAPRPYADHALIN